MSGPIKKCSCSRGKFIFWWGKSWDSSKCWWLQTQATTWKRPEKWVDALGLSLVPSAVVLLEAWALCCRSDAQFVLLKCRALGPCSPFSPCQWKGFGLFQWGWARSWELLLLVMLTAKPHARESLQKNLVLNKLFLHTEEQLCQGMWLVFIAKMCHEHLNFVTTKGHHLTHECFFHTNHYQCCTAQCLCPFGLDLEQMYNSFWGLLIRSETGICHPGR